MQLNLFDSETELNHELKERIQWINRIAKQSETCLQLIAINKLYDSFVVFNPSENRCSVAYVRNGEITEEYEAGFFGYGFGTNYLILDSRFKHRESVTLSRKRQLIGRRVTELDSYLSDGWQVEARGGFIKWEE